MPRFQKPAAWSELVSQQAESLGTKTAYRFLLKGEAEAAELSYAELWQSAASLAGHLLERFPPGSHLLLLFEPGLAFCQAFWACLLAGMVAVPVYPPADPRLRERFMVLAKDAGAAGVLTTAAIKRLISLVRWFVPSLRRLKWLAIDELEICKRELSAQPEPHQLALLQYTSGSTASPRGVMLSHGNLWQNILCLEAARCSGEPQDPQTEHVVSWLPLYHDMGLMCGVILPIYWGSGSTLFSPLHFLQKPVRWLRAVSETGATISAAPNFAYELCLKRIKESQLEGLDLSSWVSSLNGAELIRASTLRGFVQRFEPWGLKSTIFYPSYGLAETTVFACGSVRGAEPVIQRFGQAALLVRRVEALEPTSSESAVELVSVGKPFADTQLRIVDPDSQMLCPAEAVGEIWLQGDSIGRGYWQQPEATARYFEARIADESESPELNWLRTGDLGFVYRGNLFICGRIKELIILQGQNYAPQHFEAVAEGAHPAIRTGCVAAFGAGEPEALVMLAEIRPESKAPVAEIEASIRQAISEHYAVSVAQIRLLPKASLPKTSSGKLRRLAARELYLQGRLKLWKP